MDPLIATNCCSVGGNNRSGPLVEGGAKMRGGNTVSVPFAIWRSTSDEASKRGSAAAAAAYFAIAAAVQSLGLFIKWQKRIAKIVTNRAVRGYPARTRPITKTVIANRRTQCIGDAATLVKTGYPTTSKNTRTAITTYAAYASASVACFPILVFLCEENGRGDSHS